MTTTTPPNTMGRAAEMLGTTQGFLRAIGEARLITPLRSAGGHRRYSRYQLRIGQGEQDLAGEVGGKEHHGMVRQEPGEGGCEEDDPHIGVAVGAVVVREPGGVQATRLAGTTHVPRSVWTARTPLAAYTRCPHACDCTALVPPDGHICDVTPAVGRGWRRTGITWHGSGSTPRNDPVRLPFSAVVFGRA
jgi:hypothetical protein